MTHRTIRDHSVLKWLYPGMHIKRWLALLLFGIALMGLGIAYIMKEAYLQAPLPGTFYYLTLQFMPRWTRGLLFISLSLSTVGIAVYKLNESLLYAFIRPDARDQSMAEAIYNKRFLSRGPKIVAIGGGTGLSTLLRGLKDYTSNLTAIVTVADDGGSTGRLRQEFGVVAPGDMRQCIAALAESEPLMSKLFQYRFTEGTGLEGHSFGNLFIVAMSEVTGNFEAAIHEASRVLNVRGTILPSTLEDVTLSARTHEDEVVYGEHNISERGARIKDLYLNPGNVQAHPDAVRAVLDADLIVIGPGSLYTSILPNLLVPGIVEAIRASGACCVYICNVATQAGETDGYTVADHIRALEAHVGGGVFRTVIANNHYPTKNAGENTRYVRPAAGDPITQRYDVQWADLTDAEQPWRHDPQKLTQALFAAYERAMAGVPAPHAASIAG